MGEEDDAGIKQKEIPETITFPEPLRLRQLFTVKRELATARDSNPRYRPNGSGNDIGSGVTSCLMPVSSPLLHYKHALKRYVTNPICTAR